MSGADLDRFVAAQAGVYGRALAGKANVAVPGAGQTRDNRLTGLGSLSGMVTGVGLGAVFGVLRRVGLRPPTLIGGTVVGLAAMAATDSSMASMGISDPRTWSASDWLADLLPHLARVYRKLGIRSRAELGARMATPPSDQRTPARA